MKKRPVRTPPRRGRFIVLEGLDGCGKTTQARRLVARLRRAGVPVVHLREPGGTRVGEGVRAILLDPAQGEMALEAELLLYMASRAQLVRERIRPALRAGRWVVCERYLSASIAYQGIAGGLGEGAVRALGAFATGGLRPDLTVLLDVSATGGRRRIGRPQDRIEARAISFHRRVRAAFLSLARRDRRWRVVDAWRPVADVADAVWREVSRVL
jgi:dTMP kinase